MFASTIVWGLSIDHKQQVEITSDSADFNGEAGITGYYGNVVLTQGSMRIKGDTLLVYVKDNVLDHWVMEGDPAEYRQQSSSSEEYSEAVALRMEYQYTAGIITLTGKVTYKQDRFSFSGEKMQYDLEHETLRISNDDQDQSGETNTGDERIKVIIKP
ncbi:LptA, protein essential for LPS transport across the periplasm [uncultured Candidatus Thioglobus sp.]|nr:LptA, protein essential for LPS transport across the periplasm [uncultured Candidatus Thioglobus sp.]